MKVAGTVKLADIAEINPALGESVEADEQVAFVPMAAVDAAKSYVQSFERRSYAEVRKGYTGFLDGDLLVAKITPCFENGKIAQARLGTRIGFGSTEFHVVRPRSTHVDAKYLLHFLRTDKVARAGERRMTGSAGQRRVPENFLSELSVPQLGLPEQRRIAKILDQADALRAKRRAALAQLDTLIRATFFKKFGDPATNSMGLPTASLGELGRWQSGGTPPRSRDDYFHGTVPWFSSGELDRMYLSESNEHLTAEALAETAAGAVPKGALMLGMYDTAALKAGIAGVDCSCNQAIAFGMIDFKLADTVFLYSAITIGREHFRRLQRGVRQKNLNLTMIREITVPLPPISVQRQFAKEVAVIESQRRLFRASCQSLDALFASLQHRAFRGEL